MFVPLYSAQSDGEKRQINRLLAWFSICGKVIPLLGFAAFRRDFSSDGLSTLNSHRDIVAVRLNE